MKKPLRALAVKAASWRHGFHSNSSSLWSARLCISTEEGQENSMHIRVRELVCKCMLVKQHCLSVLPVAVPACHLLSVQIKAWGLIYSPVECMAELVHTTAS